MSATSSLRASPKIYRLTAGDLSVSFQRGERIRIGRHPENDLVLEDSSVSRFHARVEWARRPGPPVVADLGSSNGTFVDGVRRARAPLSELSKLIVGDVRVSLLRVDPALIDTGGTRVRLFDERWSDSRGHLREAEGVHALLFELERSRRTATFKLEDDGFRVGVTFARGHIVHAITNGGARGVAALEVLLSRGRGGSFSVTKDVETLEGNGVALPSLHAVLSSLAPQAKAKAS